jgi:hypothetical protein
MAEGRLQAQCRRGFGILRDVLCRSLGSNDCSVPAALATLHKSRQCQRRYTSWMISRSIPHMIVYQARMLS